MPAVLWLILLAGALQSVAWDLALPAFQGPDEDAHFAYVQYLAETGSVPSRGAGAGSHSSEVQAAMFELNLGSLIGNVSARPGWSSPDLFLMHQAENSLPRGSRANGKGPNPAAANPPLYYAAMAIPYRLFVWLPLLKRLFVLRLFNALCFLATIALTWLLAGELFGRVRWKQTLAAGVVALQPELAFMSAVINPDNLLVALTTAFLLMAVRLVTRGPSTGRVLGVSALAAAAVLTHGRGLVTLPVLCVALLVAWIRHRPPIRDTIVRGAGSAAIVFAAFIGYFLFGRLAGGGSLYGGQVSGYNGGSFTLTGFLSQTFQFYFPKLPSLPPRLGPDYGYRQVFIDTFYGTFGSLEVTFAARTFDLLQLLSAVGLVAFYTACVVRWRALKRFWGPVVVMLSLAATLLFFLHYISYRLLTGGTDPVVVGRYLLPMVSLFALAIVFTVGALPKRGGPYAATVILSIGVLLAVGGIGITAARFYA